MSKKYRLTGCAKIFLLLVILVPIALFVAAYVTGESPIEKIGDTVSNKTGPLKIKIEGKKEKIDRETVDLQKVVDQQEVQIEDLKKALNECMNAKE